MKEGVEAQAKALVLKLKSLMLKTTLQNKQMIFLDLLESGVSVLIINPVDSAALSTSVKQQMLKTFLQSLLTVLLIKAK